MKNYVLLSFFLFSISSFSQVISGKVLDSRTNKPIKAVSIYINNGDQGTVTNELGRFRHRSRLSKNDTIYFSHIGYEKKAISYSKKKYTIYLKAKVNELEEVLVAREKKLNYRLTYNKLTPMKKGVYSFGSVLINDKIYVIAGNISYKIDEAKRTMDMLSGVNVSFREFINKMSIRNFDKDFYSENMVVYDLNSDKWETSDLKFRKRAHHNLNFYNDNIYVLGGKNLSMGRGYEYLDNKIEIYDKEKNSIVIDNANPHQAVDFASFTFEDKIIVLGGSIKEKKSGEIEYTDKVHFLDIKSGYWYELAKMLSAKEAHGVLVEDKIYLFGGYNKKPLKEIETFDLKSGKWQKEGELFDGLNTSAITYDNDVIYIFENKKLYTYNINTKELKQYLIDLNLKSSKMYYANGKLYILGGLRENEFSLTPSRYLYSIDLKEFEKAKVHKQKRL